MLDVFLCPTRSSPTLFSPDLGHGRLISKDTMAPICLANVNAQHQQTDGQRTKEDEL